MWGGDCGRCQIALPLTEGESYKELISGFKTSRPDCCNERQSGSPKTARFPSSPFPLLPLVAAYMASNHRPVQLRRLCFMSDHPAAHHNDSIRHLLQFVKVLAYQQHGSPVISQYDQMVVYECRGDKIEPVTRIGYHQDPGFPTHEIAPEYSPLHVAA